MATSIFPTKDSCFVVCGYTKSNDFDMDVNYGIDDCFVFKINTLGDILWKSTIGGASSDIVYSITETLDGGYIFTGQSYSNDGVFADHIGTTEYKDVIVVRLDNLGEVIWSRSLGFEYDDYGMQIILTSDSNYLVVGGSDVLPYEVDYFIAKITDDGEVLWTQRYGGSEADVAHSALEISPNNYLVTGESYSDDGDVIGSHGSIDVWTLVLDINGEIVSNICYGGSGVDRWYSALVKDNNSLCFAGTSSSDDGDVTGYDGAPAYPDYWLVILDSLGVIKQQGVFGGTGTEHCYSLAQSQDGGYVMTGWTFSSDGDVVGYHDDGGPEYPYDVWTLKVNALCEPIRYYRDFDDDGYGDNDSYIYTCTDSMGYVLDNTDCNDLNNLVSPAASELCNAIDDNCDGELDEGFTYLIQFADQDADNFGNAEIDTLACPGTPGYVIDSTDCNDFNPNIYPGAPELLNGLDDDCDGQSDEGLAIVENSISYVIIYPNPTDGVCNIVFEHPIASDILITSIDGKLIFSEKTMPAEQVQIDIKNYPAGLYLLAVHTRDWIQTFQIIRN